MHPLTGNKMYCYDFLLVLIPYGKKSPVVRRLAVLSSADPPAAARLHRVASKLASKLAIKTIK